MTILDEAREILEAFGFDKKRTNELSGRILLALTSMKEGESWKEATNTRRGVRSILDWIRDELDHPIAEGSRETVRREVLHQFIDAGFCLYNDDDPNRPTNSSKNNYRLNDHALAVIQKFGSEEFTPALAEYLEKSPGLAALYAAARDMSRVPVTLPGGKDITLKSGGQNTLIKAMIDDFCALFIPGGEVLYIGDADEKLLHYDEVKFAELGLIFNAHGKFPDLIVYQPDKHWLFLMEAASTHGPIDAKRYGELSKLFAASAAGLVYVSCFPDRKTMRRFLPDLAWETEAWCASDPTHMMHFNGSRFLGPYEKQE